MGGKRSGRRAGAGLALLGCVGIAAGIALAVSRASTLDRARERAEATATFLTTGVEGFRQDLRKRTDEGGAIPELRAAVENQVDTVTFLDLFEKEDWWWGIAISRVPSCATGRSWSRGA